MRRPAACVHFFVLLVWFLAEFVPRPFSLVYLSTLTSLSNDLNAIAGEDNKLSVVVLSAVLGDPPPPDNGCPQETGYTHHSASATVRKSTCQWYWLVSRVSLSWHLANTLFTAPGPSVGGGVGSGLLWR